MIGIHPMRRLIAAVLILTLIDAVCTVAGVSAGVIAEGNPIAQYAMTTAPILTATAVLAYTGLLLAVVYRFGARSRCTVPLLAAVCAVKLAVVGMHISWITQVI